MDASFSDMAQALHDQARWERLRIALLVWMGVRGQAEPPSGQELAQWRAGLSRLQAAAGLLTALAPHEAEVRALVPDQAPPGPIETPTLWGDLGGEASPFGR